MDPYLAQMVEIAAGQHGAMTAGQVDGAGLTADQLRGRVERGLLRRVGTHVLRSPFVEATPLDDLAAIVLDCGTGAVVSGVTAAALHQFDGFELLPPFHVMLPRGTPRSASPAPRAHHERPRSDRLHAETPVVAEVLGYRWHRGSRAQFDRDAVRLNALVLDGLVPMQFTYDHVTVEPEWVLSQVETALAKFA